MKGKKIQLLLLAAALGIFSFSGCAETDDPPVESNTTEMLSGDLTVAFLDVGLGDSAFIMIPNGETILIDAGDSNAAELIISHIKNAGYGKIDYLVATHPHFDHVGGMADVVDTLDIGSVYMPDISDDSDEYRKLMDVLKKKGYRINTAKAGVNILKAGNLSVDVLAPASSSSRDLNNNSAVLKVVYGTTSFLLMGDALKQSERKIKADVDADVLKVGHHGSDYASDPAFISRVSPDYAVISVGKNTYGYPSDATLKTLTEAGSVIYRTDHDGTVTFRSDGKQITVDKSFSQ